MTTHEEIELSSFNLLADNTKRRQPAPPACPTLLRLIGFGLPFQIPVSITSLRTDGNTFRPIIERQAWRRSASVSEGDRAAAGSRRPELHPPPPSIVAYSVELDDYLSVVVDRTPNSSSDGLLYLPSGSTVSSRRLISKGLTYGAAVRSFVRVRIDRRPACMAH